MTDRRSLNSGASTAFLLPKIKQLIAASVDWVQIREKDLSAHGLAALTLEILSSAKSTNIRVLVNDRLDVALAEQAHGVHLPQNSLSVGEAKRLLQNSPAGRKLRRDFQVGASCHSLETALQVARERADYIFFGPIFSTPSKDQFGPPQGLDRLREVCSSVSIPVLAIGGITLENAASCIAAGAAGIAAIRLFQDAANPVAIVNALHQLRG